MANDTSRYLTREDRASAVATEARPAHACPACATPTLALSVVLRNSKNGQLPLTPGVRQPDPETIARWLRPPDLPAENAPVRRDIWGHPFSLASVMAGAIVGYWWSIPIALVSLAYGLNWIRKTSARPRTVVSSAEHERALALRAWDRRMEVWERLAFCPKCGLLSDPVTGRTAEWHSVPSLFV